MSLGTLVFAAQMWLNLEPAASRWNDIVGQVSEGVELDHYPVGWPIWFYHDLCDGYRDIRGLTVNLALLAFVTIGAAAFGWTRAGALSRYRFSLAGVFVAVASVASWLWLSSVTYTTGPVMTLNHWCVLMVLAAISFTWMVAFDSASGFVTRRIGRAKEGRN